MAANSQKPSQQGRRSYKGGAREGRHITAKPAGRATISYGKANRSHGCVAQVERHQPYGAQHGCQATSGGRPVFCMATPVSRLASKLLAMVASRRLSTLTRLVKSSAKPNANAGMPASSMCARHALHEVGLDGADAAHDIRELRNLLGAPVTT